MIAGLAGIDCLLLLWRFYTVGRLAILAFGAAAFVPNFHDGALRTVPIEDLLKTLLFILLDIVVLPVELFRP